MFCIRTLAPYPAHWGLIVGFCSLFAAPLGCADDGGGHQGKSGTSDGPATVDPNQMPAEFVGLSNPYSPLDPEWVELGAEHYEAHCGDCHGVYGEGTNAGIELVSATQAMLADDYLFWRVWAGIPDKYMPPWGMRMGKEITWAMITYVRWLQIPIDQLPTTTGTSTGSALTTSDSTGIGSTSSDITGTPATTQE